MKEHSISQKELLKAAQYFHWATIKHFLLWFYGELKRRKRIEVLLPRLVKKGKLRVRRYSNKFIYSVPRRVRNPNNFYSKIEHGLACTECLVRIYRCDVNCKVISEKEFSGIGIKPEWGIEYPAGRLLFEYCTKDNFERGGVIKNKIRRYDAIEGIILFVVDIEREQLVSYVSKLNPGSKYYFCDYETFLKFPIGTQLTASIYLWGEDGKEYTLR